MNAKETAQVLLEAVIPLAEKMLSDHGDFHPYGGIMKTTGEIVEVGAMSECADNGSEVLVDVLVRQFRSMAANGEFVACAVVCNSSVKTLNDEEWADAIRVCLDCSDGYSIIVYKPYRVLPGNLVKYASMLAQKGKKEIFPKS